MNGHVWEAFPLASVYTNTLRITACISETLAKTNHHFVAAIIMQRYKKICDKLVRRCNTVPPQRQRQKRVKVQFSSVCRKKSQIHSKSGSSGFARILSQMCSFLRGSKLSSCLEQIQELEVVFTHPEGEITKPSRQTSGSFSLTGRTFLKPEVVGLWITLIEM